jgi:hypothetical protein
MTIEQILTPEQLTGIKRVADKLGISVAELILRGVKSCTLVLDLFPERQNKQDGESKS